MHWQSGGKYLLVRVERSKSKKQTVTSLEIFRLKEKDIPVDVVELRANESVTSVFWEPLGDRFALLTSETNNNAPVVTAAGVAPPTGKLFVHFHEMNTASSVPGTKPVVAGTTAADTGAHTGTRVTRTLDRKGVNQVLWSPRGRIAVLAGVRGYQGELEFWDMDDGGGVGVMLGSGEHYQCTDVEWDPSGRYLTSSVSWWRVQTDPGFKLWGCSGEELTSQSVGQFKQILWRPRPRSLLSEEEMKRIRKGLKEYSREFDEADRKDSREDVKEEVEKREKLWSEWVAYRLRCIEDWKNEKQERIKVVGFDMEEDAVQGMREIEEFVDEVIDEVEEIVEDDEDDD